MDTGGTARLKSVGCLQLAGVVVGEIDIAAIGAKMVSDLAGKVEIINIGVQNGVGDVFQPRARQPSDGIKRVGNVTAVRQADFVDQSAGKLVGGAKRTGRRRYGPDAVGNEKRKRVSPGY